ncbi:MAG: dTMP kinase, partial [Rhodovibrionaceae bacterium]|nr:dTMP kinase [Rhodovibrionaceae bacterium]
MSNGKFITLEGGEGAGKSTQVRLLCEAVAAAGIDAVGTREPGGSPGAEAVRKLLLHGAEDGWTAMTEALLHFAARREHLDKTILPAIARGSWVISDRFADSTMAYQGYGQGL